LDWRIPSAASFARKDVSRRGPILPILIAFDSM